MVGWLWEGLWLAYEEDGDLGGHGGGVCVVLVLVLGEGRSVSGVILLDRGMERRGERERQERRADYMDLYIYLSI